MTNKKLLNEEIHKIKSMMRKLIKESDEMSMDSEPDSPIDDKYSVDELVNKVYDKLDFSDAKMTDNKPGKFSNRYRHLNSDSMTFEVEADGMTDDNEEYNVTITFGVEQDEDEDGPNSNFFWNIQIEGNDIKDELSDELRTKIVNDIDEFWANMED
jgi:hypothetical protein